MRNVIKFPLSPSPSIPKRERIDTGVLTDEQLRFLCGNVIDASLKEEAKTDADAVAKSTISWLILHADRKMLEKFVDWIHGGMEVG